MSNYKHISDDIKAMIDRMFSLMADIESLGLHSEAEIKAAYAGLEKAAIPLRTMSRNLREYADQQKAGGTPQRLESKALSFDDVRYCFFRDGK